MDADTDMNFSKNRGHGHVADKPRTRVSTDLWARTSIKNSLSYNNYLIGADEIPINSDGSAHCDSINNHGDSEDYVCNDQTNNDHSKRVI